MSNNPLPQGKRIHVYRSGDPNFGGAQVTYNPMVFRKMDNFLGEIAEKVPIWGAVRSIHTPNTGTLVKDLNALSKDTKYVAAGPKGFVSIPGGYENIGKHILHKKSDIKSHKVIRRLGIHEEKKKIYIYQNGDPAARSRPFEISNDDNNWDLALERMSDVVKLASGPVKKLYDSHGRIVDSPEALQDKGYYVAAGPGEAFRAVKYGGVVGQEALNIKSTAATVNEDGSSPRQLRKRLSQTGRKPRRSKSIFRPGRRKSKPNLGATENGFEDEDEGEAEGRNNKSLSSNLNKYKKSSVTRLDTKSIQSKRDATTKPNRRKSQEEEATESISKMSINGSPQLRRSKSVQSRQSIKPDVDAVNRNWSSQDDIDDIDRLYESLSQYQKEDKSGTATEDEETAEEDEEEARDHYKDDDEQEIDSGRGSLFTDNSGRDSIFRAKEKSRPSTTISVDYDADKGGIFRAKSRSQYTRNAKQVLEDSKTKIEIPVDFMEAKEVSEEVY